MKKTDRPSEYFLGAILRAYDTAQAEGRQVTPSALWDYVVMECLRRGDFVTMFRWDTSTAKNKNRIRDIAECLERGLVPGLRLGRDDRGRVFFLQEGVDALMMLGIVKHEVLGHQLLCTDLAPQQQDPIRAVAAFQLLHRRSHDHPGLRTAHCQLQS